MPGPNGTSREPAERTLVGSLFTTNLLAGLAGFNGFPGVGICVVEEGEAIIPASPAHSDPCPAILNTRAVIESKADEAYTGIRPL